MMNASFDPTTAHVGLQEIKLSDKLGEGDGGVIYHAHWRGLDVVAKMLKTDGPGDSTISSKVARADLINEISVLSRRATSTPLHTACPAAHVCSRFWCPSRMQKACVHAVPAESSTARFHFPFFSSH